MGLRHHHRDEPATIRYQMRQKLLSVGGDSWIDEEAGNHVFKANGKAARRRDTFVLEDASGADVARIKERVLSVRDKMSIDLDGRSATVKKALMGLRERFHVELDGGADLKVHGNIVDHEVVLCCGTDNSTSAPDRAALELRRSPSPRPTGSVRSWNNNERSSPPLNSTA